MATVSSMLHHAFEYFDWTVRNPHYSHTAMLQMRPHIPQQSTTDCCCLMHSAHCSYCLSTMHHSSSLLQGFYCVWPHTSPEMLVVGPYQGTLGCLRIPFSRGVCGAAAATQQTQLVPDVHCFEGHIACASRWGL